MDNKTKGKGSAAAAADDSSNSSSARDARRYDLIVWGATGFTGQLVVQYLTRRQYNAKRGADTDSSANGSATGYAALKWAVGGRSRDKLDAAKATALKELTAADGALANAADVTCEAEVIIADSGDSKSLSAMVTQTRVVLTTVGPYAVHGSALVAACAAHGTDYVDITGEHAWVKGMIDAHHEAAVKSGAIIVPCCGYDSIPSDLGTFMAVQHLKRAFGATTHVNTVQMTAAAGGGAGASGGTLHTMMGIMDEAAKDPKTYGAVLRNPYVLVPESARPSDGAVRGEQELPLPMSVPHGRAPGKAAWTAPFLMSTVNGAITRRSAYLWQTRGDAYGPNFVYKSERMVFPHFLGALAFILVLATVALACTFGAVRRAIVKYVLPAQGQGPSKAKRATAWFRTTIIATGTTVVAPGASESERVGVHAVAQVRGGDPGYDDTSKMVSEAAMCLVVARKKLPAASQGGILTPASAFGDVLVERLRAPGGLQLEVLTASADSPLVVAQPVSGAGAGAAAAAAAAAKKKA